LPNGTGPIRQDDCSTIYIRQAIWRGKEQDPKTDAAVRDVDVPKELAAMLAEFIGDRKDGFLFRSASGKSLSPLQRAGWRALFPNNYAISKSYC
jgi:hypothetical protein